MDALLHQIPTDSTTADSSATQRAYVALRRKILIGDLPPSEKLKIEDLRKALDMGSSPIREALSLLTSDQLVERIDQRGFITAPISRANFEEILELRCALEDKALRLSIKNATDDWEENAILAHHRMVRAVGEADEFYERCHKTFHMTLLSACNSPILLRFCSQLYDLNIRYRYIAGKASSYPKRDVSEEHSAILADAIKHDADNAAKGLLDHYKKTGSFLADFFPPQ